MKNDVLDDLTVVKRSGQRVKFNASKIAIAVKKAFESTYDEVDENDVFKVFGFVLTYINNNYKERKTISVEDIQDIIEKMLNDNFKNVYITFSEYRKKRSASRQVFNERQQHKFVKAIEKVQNYDKSNNNLIPKQMINKFGKIISNEYAKSYLLDNKYIRLLEEGNIYIHNLDYFSLGLFPHYIYKMNCKEKNNIIDVLLEIKNLSSEVIGSIGITNIDLKFKKIVILKYREFLKINIKKHFEIVGLIDYINFKKYDEVINKIDDLEDNLLLEQFKVNRTIKLIIENAIVNAKKEVGLFINEIIDLLFKILTEGKYVINLSNDDNIITNLFNKALVNYLNNHDRIENIIFVLKLKNDKDIVNLILNNKNVILSNELYFDDGIKMGDDGKLVIGNTSLNLARLGLKYQNKSKNTFYDYLDSLLDNIKNELLLVFEHIGNKNKNNYENLFHGIVYEDEKLDGNQKIRKVIKSGDLYVGIVGLYECSKLLNISMTKILKFIKNRLDDYTEESKIKFNLYEPNDLKSRKYLMGIDKSIYGEIKDITDKDYYLTLDNYINDSEEYIKLAKYFDNNIKYCLELKKNISAKKISEILNKFKNIPLLEIRMEK